MMIDAQLLAAPLLDHRGLDLDSAASVTYVLEQSFRYEYAEPVTALRQRLVAVPKPRHGSQYRRAHLVEVSGAPARRSTHRDAHGNNVVRVRADSVASAIEFRVAAVIERVRDGSAAGLPAEALRSPRLLRATPLTRASEQLVALAGDLTDGRLTPVEKADQICALVHGALAYEYGPTTVRTTAAEALAGGAGVCQDFAHVMLALCHIVGLPARYVSGHLLGQGGTHAWVEVIVPSGSAATVAAFDPCNGGRASSAYVTIATGRDYSDVAPTSGSYIGTARATLTTQRRVGVLAAA
jgi:transglutaminase-like putative cysteine protease